MGNQGHGGSLSTQEPESSRRLSGDGQLQVADFDRVADDPPSDQTDKMWREGFNDGQALVFHQTVAKR